MQALLKTCLALTSCAHPTGKRSRYRVVAPDGEDAAEAERCKACGALLVPNAGREQEWEWPELVQQLADEIAPETCRAWSEILDATVEVLKRLEVLAGWFPHLTKVPAASVARVRRKGRR